jgi:hypothetical protein
MNRIVPGDAFALRSCGFFSGVGWPTASCATLVEGFSADLFFGTLPRVTLDRPFSINN